ncbi:Long-chain-fatty-acid--CoA ligase [Methylobacterium tardum]|uniref:Long-chain-fatty-acid--CoA ligase n=1 Tax=Methylobacterium tardum TaxID=374432 RepID=A0AA37WUT7_9HYPH|nr:AMP-binding protein [Methylobacterium tardum]URD39329.1 AMP-binding protein [Methylobacterium tardum]GJE48791.1 Long-chain-fatty-acid--CoA ligase [Methylobacterium tardum]GLS73931.1 long-chain-fatty-acid--CoA ligase [Methylobacterium tardum]
MHEANVIVHGAETPRSVRRPAPPADLASDRPWLASYPAGVPAEIDVAGLGTLVGLFETSVAAFADRPAMLCFGSTMTYATLGQQARDLAAWLQGQGLAKGDRVAIMLPNVPAYAVAIFGVLLAGGTVVNTNPLYTPREFAQQINDSGARILIVLENFGATVAAALPDVKLDRVALVGPGDGLGLKGQVINLASRHVRKAVPPFQLPEGLAVPFTSVLRRGRSLPRASARVEPEDLAFLQYTGGTTGIAKAAMLSHRNIMANVEQSQLWFNSKDPSIRRCAVTALPLYHIFALTACFFQFMRNGGSCLLIPNPRDCDGMVKTLSRTRFTHLMGVNTLFNVLINHPKIGTIDFSHLDFVVGGGTAVQRAVAERWKALTGNTIIEGYGLSETSPVVCVNPRGMRDFSGTIGFPLPSTEVSIRDLSGQVVSVGQPGEICVRGPQVMRGYWNRPEETARAMTADGFFRTGDVAVMQADGQFRIVDRMKDMILVSGFNVYPNEVEDVLAAHPAVLECAVVGAPSEETGEMVVAHIVLKDSSVSTDAIRAHARTQLTGYKVPRRVILHDTLPKTNVGKVLRRMLRDETPPA